MRITISQTETYVPEWNGNRELPEDEQISVTYEKLYGNLMARSMSFSRGEFGQESGLDYEKLARNCITEIKNLEVNGNKIDKYSLGATRGLHDLFVEVITNIILSSKVDNELGKKNQDNVALDKSI